jgi:Zn finger protein HypA/HybF involved in hydrogenase expression
VHEKHLFDKIISYLENEEKSSSKKIIKICISLSEFGGLSKEHFLEHFQEAAKLTRWKNLDIEFKSVPFGSEFEITKIVFK